MGDLSEELQRLQERYSIPENHAIRQRAKQNAHLHD